MTRAYLAFTDTGLALARRLADALPGSVDRCGSGGVSLAGWTALQFAQSDALVFVGAVGIAVRAIAPHCRSKASDPAVVVLDECGRFAVPVLSGHLGGASQRARELMLLCEAAGYDVVIVETVGVGQSETEVARMVDCFISLQIAGGGDDLQGIKKGLMEVADLIVINKDDADNHTNVAIARHMYESALHILRRKYDEWQPRVLTCSALEKRGIDEIWHAIIDFKTALTASGRLQQVRQQQSVEWLRKQTEEEVLNHLFANEDFDRYYRQTLLAVKNNTLSPRTGLRQLSEFIQTQYFD